MGAKYRQLVMADRIILEKMLARGCSKTKVAEFLGIHRSTIYRELERNSSCHWRNKKKYYHAHFAQRYALKRRKRALLLERNSMLRHYVHQKLKQGWSPWQIEGRLKLENNPFGKFSHETIYRYIYSHWKRRNEFTACLRRQHKSRIKHGSRKARVPEQFQIALRPSTVEEREEFGHWECDLMIFKRHIKSNLITLVERKTRFTVVIKNASRHSKATAINIISRLSCLKDFVKSITFDQGTEFSQYVLIKECLDVDIYFCEKASPHQKGSIENRNGVLRTLFPRGFDIAQLAQEKIDYLALEVNNRPTQCLGYETPSEVFNRHLSVEEFGYC